MSTIYETKGRARDNLDELRRLYWEENMSMAMLASRFGCASSHISDLFIEFHIPKRTRSEAMNKALHLGRATLPALEMNPNYKGGRAVLDGYVGILDMTHEGPGHHGYVFEHRLVWEQHDGAIPEGWIVHHLNGCTQDNRIENLLALPRKNHHYALLMQALRKRIRALEADNIRLRAERRLI